MASSLLHPPAHLSPAVALQLSQQAPYLLRTTPSAISPYSMSSLWSAAESPELWTTYENLMLSCLRTGDEQSAHLCLERLTERFGADNERLMALRGLFQEAIANDNDALKKVLKEYENILVEDPANMVSICGNPFVDCSLTPSPIACIEASYCAPHIHGQNNGSYYCS